MVCSCAGLNQWDSAALTRVMDHIRALAVPAHCAAAAHIGLESGIIGLINCCDGLPSMSVEFSRSPSTPVLPKPTQQAGHKCSNAEAQYRIFSRSTTAVSALVTAEYPSRTDRAPASQPCHSKHIPSSTLSRSSRDIGFHFIEAQVRPVEDRVAPKRVHQHAWKKAVSL